MNEQVVVCRVKQKR